MTKAVNEATYPQTPRTTGKRRPDRVGYDVAAIHAVLDEGFVCHVGYPNQGAPLVLPTLYVRVGEMLYLHGSTGAGLMLYPDETLPICVTITLTDGIVLARSWFNHSINYRSVVVRGDASLVTDPDEKMAALTALVEHVARGRAADSRPPNRRELAATAVLRLPLAEVSLKVRSGPPIDDEEDLALPFWAGVIPAETVFGPPEPDSALPVPAYACDYQRHGAGS
jgi:nitroimidazol reductase NimA-like FMN-containing flavoprotein (pyridoxamine 5'-phosphate oxidase superfamily)